MRIPTKTKIIVLILFFAVSSINFTRTALDILKSSKRLDDLNSDISVLESEKNKLSKEIEYKKTSDYIEDRARNDLNMVKPGEKILVFIDSSKKKTDNTIADEPLTVLSATQEKSKVLGVTAKKDTNLKLWYQLFFSKRD